MNDKKLEKLVKLLTEMPDNSVIHWSVNKSVINQALEAGKVTVIVSELASEVGSEALWELDSSKDAQSWVFGDHKPNLKIFLPTTRKLITSNGKAEVVKNSTTYELNSNSSPVWAISEINAILASWVYDVINRSDLVFEFRG